MKEMTAAKKVRAKVLPALAGALLGSALPGAGLMPAATAQAQPSGPAIKCVFAVPDMASGSIETHRLHTLREGTSRGLIKCMTRHQRADVWTLDIGNSPTVGVRVGPLFRTSIVGKLGTLARLTIKGAARLTIFEPVSTIETTRAGNISRRYRYQVFMTLCDASTAADPLNCWFGTARVKGRVTMVDGDRDGELDTAQHEISVFDGGSRLHVIAFNTTLAAEPEDHAGRWVEALAATTALPSFCAPVP